MLLKEIAPYHERVDQDDLLRFVDSWIEASTHDNFERPHDLAPIVAALEERHPALDFRVVRRIAKYVFEWITARRGNYLPGQTEILDFLQHTLRQVPRAA